MLYTVCIEYAYLFYRVYRMSERMISEMVSMLPPPTAIPNRRRRIATAQDVCTVLC